MKRRAFLAAIAAAAAIRRLEAQAVDVPAYGGPVRDCHFHLRPDFASNLAHMIEF